MKKYIVELTTEQRKEVKYQLLSLRCLDEACHTFVTDARKALQKRYRLATVWT